jgi:hypothetical protein
MGARSESFGRRTAEETYSSMGRAAGFSSLNEAEVVDQMTGPTRDASKTITMPAPLEESVPEPITQRKRVDGKRFRLQVDRQTKASYATYEAAEKAGQGIKKEHPILQVAVYDGVESVNKIIELP